MEWLQTALDKMPVKATILILAACLIYGGGWANGRFTKIDEKLAAQTVKDVELAGAIKLLTEISNRQDKRIESHDQALERLRERWGGQRD